MQRTTKGMKKTSTLLMLAISLTTLFYASTTLAAEASVVDQGKELSFDRKKGNCLSCHQIEGGDMMGNVGPPLIAMKARFPDKAKLRAQIWDSTQANPNTMMPPFGKHRALTEDEIDKIVEYIYTL